MQFWVANDNGVVQLTDARRTLCLLGKGGSPPSGTVFTAIGASTTYHFGYAPNGSSYGLTTRDESGQVLFDAVTYGRMAKPVGVMSGSIATTESQTKVSVFPSGRTYAVWIVSRVSTLRPRPGQGQIGGVLNYWYHLDTQDMDVEINGGEVKVTAYRTLDNSQNGINSIAAYLGDAKYDWRAVVLDVTNY